MRAEREGGTRERQKEGQAEETDGWQCLLSQLHKHKNPEPSKPKLCLGKISELTGNVICLLTPGDCFTWRQTESLGVGFSLCYLSNTPHAEKTVSRTRWIAKKRRGEVPRTTELSPPSAKMSPLSLCLPRMSHRSPFWRKVASVTLFGPHSQSDLPRWAQCAACTLWSIVQL